jgi:hypothetical protein
MANTDTDTPGAEGTTGKGDTPPKPDTPAPDTSKSSDIPSPPVQTQSLSPQGALGGWHPDTSQLSGGTTAGQTDHSIAAYLGIPSFGEPSKLKAADGKPIVSDEQMRSALEQHKADNAQTINAINDNAAAQKNLYEKLGKLGHPGIPDLKDIPQTPRSELRASFEVFRNPLMLAAVLGTFAMRGHAKTAMQAASGAMEGFQQGDQKRVKLENERFKMEVERLKANNQIALDRYKVKMEDKKLEGQDYLNQIHGLAMELDHKVMASEAAKGNFTATWDIYKAIKASDEKFAEAILRHNERYGAQAAKQTAAEKKQSAADEAQKGKVDNFMTTLDAAIAKVSNLKETATMPQVGGLAAITKIGQENIPRFFGKEGSTTVSDLQRDLANLKDQYSQVMLKKGRLLSGELRNLDQIIPGSIKGFNISATKGVQIPNFTTLAETENALRELQGKMNRLYPEIIRAEQQRQEGAGGSALDDASDEEVQELARSRGLLQ